MRLNLFIFMFLVFALCGFGFSQYLSYDGVNIHFGNESQISVSTCNEFECYLGFRNLGPDPQNPYLNVRPLSDDFVNISMFYNMSKSEVCVLKFISPKPLIPAPSEDKSIVLFYNEDVSFAIISVSNTTDSFYLNSSEGNTCVGVQNQMGLINFYLASPLWIRNNIALEPSPNLNESGNLTGQSENGNSSAGNNPNDTSQTPVSASDFQLKPEYIAFACVVIFILTVAVILFSRGKKTQPKTSEQALTPPVSFAAPVSNVSISPVQKQQIPAKVQTEQKPKTEQKLKSEPKSQTPPANSGLVKVDPQKVKDAQRVIDEMLGD